MSTEEAAPKPSSPARAKRRTHRRADWPSRPCRKSIAAVSCLSSRGIRRDIGLRTRPVAQRIVEMPPEEASPTLPAGASAPAGTVFGNFDVRIDPARLDRPSRRREVERGGEMQRPVAERDRRLHRSLAERSRPDQGRPLEILQRAGDDLGRRRRAAVDEDDQRLALRQVLARPRGENLIRSGARPRVDRIVPLSTKAFTVSTA